MLKIESNAEWKELYFGPFKHVKEKATYSKRDNKYMIPVAKLKDLGRDLRSFVAISATSRVAIRC